MTRADPPTAGHQREEVAKERRISWPEDRTNGSKSAGMKRAAAAALAMRTVTFTGRYAFRADLDRYGVTFEL
jgi:hypothetical protein